MAKFGFPFGGKKKNNDEEVVQDTAVSSASDKQREKKIKNMKKKFEETVWNSVLEIMKQDIPKFVVAEPDPDDAELQITKYVCLGFDTKIVDDFSNKTDDDIGSMMTALKSSMDVVIEHGLFDNEMILLIPTTRTLNAIKEFEETFELQFSIVYCYDNHKMQIETLKGSDQVLYVTLDDIRDMLENGLYVGDMIASKQNGAMVSDDFNNTLDTNLADDANDMTDDDVEDIPEEDIPEEDIPEEDIPEEGISDKIPYEDKEMQSVSKDKLTDSVTVAVKENEVYSQNVGRQKDDMIPEEQSQVASANQNQTSTVDVASATLDKLKSAVQTASDEALKDDVIRSSAANINPAARMQTFDMAQMDQYVTRRYYSDDLGLEISSQPFDAMFMQSNPYIPFVEVENDNWLSGYVNNLRRDANARLAKLHHENLLIMRERFMLIITKHCESITKAVTIDDPKARFGYALKAITKIKNDNLANLAETAEAYKREKEAEYQERMKAEMTNASNIAKANFINKYGKEHERELREIEQDLKNNIESEFIAARDNLQMERQAEAKRQLDVGISEALTICADEYTKMLAVERKEYVRLQEVITEFQNENMAADEARINTLSEEHRRKNEVNEIRAEYDSKFDSATKDFEAKFAAVKAEIDRANIDHDNYITELRMQHEKDLQDLRDRHSEQIDMKLREITTLNEQLDSANYQIEVLTEKYANLDDEVAAKYANQIDMLKSEREAWEDRASHVENLHKYTDKLKLTGMVVGVAAALGIGIIIGCAVTSDRNTKSEIKNAPIVHCIEQDSESNETDSIVGDEESKENKDNAVENNVESKAN